MADDARRPLVTALALVLIVGVLLAGGVLVQRYVAAAFVALDGTMASRTLAFEALGFQLDEETGIRGYDASGDPKFLEPFRSAESALPDALVRLRDGLPPGTKGDAATADALAANRDWLSTVAGPVLRGDRGDAAVQSRGKMLVDRFRRDIDVVYDVLSTRLNASRREASAAITRVTLFVGVATLVLILVAYGLMWQQSHLFRRLEAARILAEERRRNGEALRAAFNAERRIAETLQDAIAQRPLPLVPTLRFSATYVPATEDTKVGGDWYDVLELPAGRVLFAIGDVAGHGIEAAVTMNRARQSLVNAALLDLDPASVLHRVNADLLRQGSPMVTALAGFADSKTYEFVYASAGHPPPVLIEPGRAPRLLACGGLPLGVGGKGDYTSHRVQSVPGAILVLYTDGAVEHSHDVIAGEELLLQAAAGVAQHPEADPASVIHDEIFRGHRVGDDVAILTVGFTVDRTTGLTLSGDCAQTAFAGRSTRPVNADLVAAGALRFAS